MRTKRILLASSAAAVISSVTAAQAGTDFYINVSGGGNFQGDRSSSFDTLFDEASAHIDPDTGFVISGAFGVHLQRWLAGLRAEIEASFRRNELGGLWTTETSFIFSDSGPIDGHLSTFAMLANVWYDIDIGLKAVPYVGGGVGWGRSKFEGAFLGAGPSATFSIENSGFVYQLGGGLNYEVQDGVHLGMGYRYFRGPTVRGNVFLGKAGSLPIQGENDNHSVLISLTIDTN